MFLYYFNVNYILEDDPEDDKEKSINGEPKKDKDSKEGSSKVGD